MDKFHNTMYIIGLIMLGAILYAFPILILWNLVIVDLFHLPQISFFQSIGLRLFFLFLISNQNKNFLTIKKEIINDPNQP